DNFGDRLVPVNVVSALFENGLEEEALRIFHPGELQEGLDVQGLERCTEDAGSDQPRDPVPWNGMHASLSSGGRLATVKTPGRSRRACSPLLRRKTDFMVES